MSNNYPLYLIDACIPFFRYYFVMPPRWVSDEGQCTAAVYGFTHWLKRFLLQVQPARVVACFDESLGSCFRNEIYPGYKASRPQPDFNITYQLGACKSVVEYMGVPVYASNRYEADDLIGTLAAKNTRQGGTNIIISGDKDLIQLVGPNDAYWNYPNDPRLDYQACTRKMGVRPEQISDYLALVGDKVDDIPGVPGVGPKTARLLLAQFESIAHLMAELPVLHKLELRGAKSLATKLEAHAEQIAMAQKLTKICTKATLNKRYQHKKKAAQLSNLQLFARSMGFNLSSQLL